MKRTVAAIAIGTAALAIAVAADTTVTVTRGAQSASFTIPTAKEPLVAAVIQATGVPGTNVADRLLNLIRRDLRRDVETVVRQQEQTASRTNATHEARQTIP
jgi:hypothetical protein